MVIFYSFLESPESKLSDIFWIGGIFVFSLSKVAHSNMGVSENSVPHLPNGFADHYPVFKWLFVWEYTLFSDKPIWLSLKIGCRNFMLKIS